MNKILNKYLRITANIDEFSDKSYVKLINKLHPLCNHNLILDSNYELNCIYNCCPHIPINLEVGTYKLNDISHKIKKNKKEFNIDLFINIVKHYFCIFYPYDEKLFFIIKVLNCMKELFINYKVITRKLVYEHICFKKNTFGLKNLKLIDQIYSLIFRTINLDYSNNFVSFINVKSCLKQIHYNLVFIIKNFKNLKYCEYCGSLHINIKKKYNFNVKSFCVCEDSKKVLIDKIVLGNFDEYYTLYQRLKILNNKIIILLNESKLYKKNNTINLPFVEELIIKTKQKNNSEVNTKLFKKIYEYIKLGSNTDFQKHMHEEVKLLLKHYINGKEYSPRKVSGKVLINTKDIEFIDKYSELFKLFFNYNSDNVTKFINYCYKKTYKKSKRKKLCL